MPARQYCERMSATHAPASARHARVRLGAAAAVGLLVITLATACSPGDTSSGASAPAGPSSSPSDSAASTPGASAPGTSATPTSTPTPTAAPVAIPSDCRAIVSPAVLSYFGDTPLNDPLTGVATGTQPDQSLICLWRDPRADTTFLVTKISRENRGPALDLLNGLAETQGFACFTPDGGTRCEKTWQNETYPVTDGRTLFWRDDVLIDTTYSNVAPPDYTSSIIAALWG